MTTPQPAFSIDRAALPEIMFVDDLCLVLGGLTASAVRRALRRGELGPYLKIGRRLALRRASLVSALEAREILIEPVRVQQRPADVERYVALLRGRGGR